MKKVLLPLTALAILTLAGCNGGGSTGLSTSVSSSSESTIVSSESSIVASVEIVNKEELTAEWHVGDNDRSLDLELDPRVNILEAIADGTIVITSSDDAVVDVIGRNLHAAGEGTATITVSYLGKSDSVEIEVEEMLGEPDYEKATLTEMMAIEEGLVPSGSNKYYGSAFMTKVKVAVLGNKKDGSGAKDKYGNMYVTDLDSDELVQVYGSGVSFEALNYDLSLKAYKYSNKQNYLDNPFTNIIKVGDVLDVVAIRADYNTTKEISMVIRAINGNLTINDTTDTDHVNVTPDSPNVRKQIVTVSGVITGWKDANTNDGTKYGNFYLQTEDSLSDPVYVYGATASTEKVTIPEGGDPIYTPVIQMQEDGSLKFNNPQDWLTNEETKDLKIGDKITLHGFRCDYQGKIELTGMVEKYIEPAEEPDPVDATIAELVAKTAPEKNVLYSTGGVWEFGKGDKYGNGYLTDPLTGASIMVYGATTTATAFTFDGKTGEPVFSWKNPQDAIETLADLENGMYVECIAMNAYYAGTNTPEIYCVITDMGVIDQAYSATAETAEHGQVSLSKTEGLTYGEEVTVTATPAEGYVLEKVEVIDAHGGKTTLGEDMKFKATCVNKVVATFSEPSASTDINITVDSMGQPSQAYTAEVTKAFGDVTVVSANVGNYGNGLQYRIKDGAASNIYNSTATGSAIKSIKVTQTSGKFVAADKTFLTISGGTAAIAAPVNADGVAGAAAVDGVWTVNFTQEQNFTFFSVGHHTSNSGAVYIASIVVELY